MKTLVLFPIQEEIDPFLKAIAEKGIQPQSSVIGRLPVVNLPDLGITLARGGLGKVQFAVHTQHLLDACPDWDLVICAGAAGGLVDKLSARDVVVSTETVEHDIKNKFGKPRLPRFSAGKIVITEFRRASQAARSFQVHFGPIASGDEDVVDFERRKALHELTGALAVAWEGAGGARACFFSDVPYIEIRGVTDNANEDAASDFEANLDCAMRNIATLIYSWARGRHT